MNRVLREKVSQWKRIRNQTRRKVYDIADLLAKKRREHVEKKCSNAKTSLASDVIGLGGILLAPFSGGLSLGATAVASGLAARTLYSGYGLDERNSKATKEKLDEAKHVLDQYNSKSKELLETYEIIEKVKEMDIIVQVRDAMVIIHHVKMEKACVNISRRDVDLNDVGHRSGNTGCSGHFDAVKAIGYANSALNNSGTVIEIARHTERISRQTSICAEIISVAKSVREIGTSVRPDALANVALPYNSLIHLGISQPIRQVTMLPNGFQMMNGMLSSTSKIGLNGVVSGSNTVLSSFKQSQSTLNAAVTAKSGKTTLDAVVNVKKTSQITKSVSQTAAGSDKVVRITRASKTVKETSKISGTVTKAASISKVGVALSAVAIPLDIYNLVNAENEKETTPEEVKNIRDAANRIGNEMLEKIAKIETFEEMHIQVLKVYEETPAEILYEFLQICYQKLHLELPRK